MQMEQEIPGESAQPFDGSILPVINSTDLVVMEDGNSIRDNDDLSIDDASIDDASLLSSVATKSIISTDIDMDQVYLDKIKIAVEEESFRLCLVFLNRIKNRGESFIRLTAFCVYCFWKQGCKIENDGLFDRCKWEKIVLDVVLDRFSLILSGSLDLAFVPPSYYLQLSQVYISQNSLSSALKIIQLACARGYLENVLIVVQSYCILKRIRINNKEADEAITFLCSAIVQEDREASDDKMLYVPGSNVPMYHFYLLCALEYVNKANAISSTHYRKVYLDNFQSLVTEAYMMGTGRPPGNMMILLAWFNNPTMWYDCATYLEEKTVFLLLSQDFYWESFKRSPLSNDAITMLVYNMRKYMTEEVVVRRLLEKAMKTVSKVNTYCREELVRMEIRDNTAGNVNSWSNRFIKDRQYIAKIQGRFRLYQIKKNWQIIKQKYEDKKKYFLAMMEIAKVKFAMSWEFSLRDKVRFWRRRTIELKELKYACATMIQAHWRRKYATVCYAWSVYRVQRANYNFVAACEAVYNTRRKLLFTKWAALAKKIKYDRATYIISTVIMMHGKSKRFYDAMERLLNIMKIMRRYSNRNTWKILNKVYKYRQRKHARVTIRFWYRQRLDEIEQKSIENRLKHKELKVVALVKYNRHVRLRPMWNIWQLEIRRKYEHKCKIKVAYLLPKLFRRVKERWRIKRKRARLEGQTSLLSFAYHIGVVQKFQQWKISFFVRKIQRFLRISMAKKKLKRKRKIKFGVIKFEKTRRLKIIRKIFCFHFPKYLYLQRRYRYSCARIIKKFLWKLVTKTRMTKLMKKRMHLVRMLRGVDRAFTKMQFVLWRDGAIIQKKLSILEPYFNTVLRHIYRIRWHKIQRYVSQQRLLGQLVERLICNKLSNKFFPNCHVSIRLPKHVSRNDLDNTKASKESFFVWEKRLKIKKIRQSMTSYHLMKAFYSWISQFRLKLRNRYMGVRMLIPSMVEGYLTNAVVRCVKAHVIGRSFRCASARFKLDLLYKGKRREIEVVERIQSAPILKTFKQMIKIAKLRSYSRFVLQCWGRVALAMQKTKRLRKYFNRLHQASIVVGSTRVQRGKARETMRSLQYIYCVRRAMGMAFPVKTLLHDKSAPPGPMKSAMHRSMSTNDVMNNSAITSSDIMTKRLNTKPLKQTHKVLADGSIKLLEKNIKMNKKNKFSNTVTLAPVSDGPDKTVAEKLNVLSHQHDLDYYSKEFNANLFRIKQTGIFKFDASRALLSRMELDYCLTNATTIFLEDVTLPAIQEMARYFHGNKIVLCRGAMRNKEIITELLTYLTTVKDISSFSVHIVDINITFQSVLLFLDSIRDVVFSSLAGVPDESVLLSKPLYKLSCLKELSSDTLSFGVLGIGTLLTIMKYNTSIEVLIIKCTTPSSWLSSYGNCIRYMSSNNKLKELRIFNGSLNEEIVKGLHDSLIWGLDNLTVLEFSTSTKSSVLALADSIIYVAKDRLFKGRTGVSVHITPIK